jgi:hypothetical protein
MALWIAITTTYGRCFGLGRRQYFAATFVPQYHDLARVHRWMLAHRNRTIAHLHKTSDGEVARAFVGIDGDEVLAIKFEGERWVMPDPSTLVRVRRLLRYLYLKAQQRRDNAGHKVVDAVRLLSPHVRAEAVQRSRRIHVARPPDTAEEARSRATTKPKRPRP